MDNRVIIDTETKNIFGNAPEMTIDIYLNLKDLWVKNSICNLFRFPAIGTRDGDSFEFEMMGGWTYSQSPDYIPENTILQGDYFILVRRVSVLERQFADLRNKLSRLEEEFNKKEEQ